jgi:preprotein translocase SecE subunit
MARTRQKSKQRKAKRLEQEQRASGRSAPKDAAEAVDDAIASEAAALPAEDGRTSDEADTALEEVAPAPAPARPRGRTAAPEKAPARTAKAPAKERARPKQQPERRQPRRRGRVLGFFKNVWAELKRVQWPDRNQVTQATAVVVVFCFMAGLYLAVWDWAFNKLVKALF